MNLYLYFVFLYFKLLWHATFGQDGKVILVSVASQFVELPPLVMLSHKLKIIKQTENSLMLKMGRVQMVISDQLAGDTMHLTDPKQ